MTQNILEHNLNSTVVVIMLKVASSSALFLARDVRIVCISMFPPPIPLWGSYPIPLGKQLLSSPQFSHSILGHSKKDFDLNILLQDNETLLTSVQELALSCLVNVSRQIVQSANHKI